MDRAVEPPVESEASRSGAGPTAASNTATPDGLTEMDPATAWQWLTGHDITDRRTWADRWTERPLRETTDRDRAHAAAIRDRFYLDLRQRSGAGTSMFDRIRKPPQPADFAALWRDLLWRDKWRWAWAEPGEVAELPGVTERSEVLQAAARWVGRYLESIDWLDHGAGQSTAALALSCAAGYLFDTEITMTLQVTSGPHGRELHIRTVDPAGTPVEWIVYEAPGSSAIGDRDLPVSGSDPGGVEESDDRGAGDPGTGHADRALDLGRPEAPESREGAPPTSSANPGWRLRRWGIEMELAGHLYKSERSRAAALAMLDRLQEVLRGLHPGRPEADIEAAFFGRSALGWDGMVPPTVTLAELRRDGNLRELMSAVYNAMGPQQGVPRSCGYDLGRRSGEPAEPAGMGHHGARSGSRCRPAGRGPGVDRRQRSRCAYHRGGGIAPAGKAKGIDFQNSGPYPTVLVYCTEALHSIDGNDYLEVPAGPGRPVVCDIDGAARTITLTVRDIEPAPES